MNNDQAFPGTDDMRTPEQVSDYIKAQNAKWPAGYCLDPNGNMVCPEGPREAWAFGYDIGYQDAFKTLKSAQLKVMIEADAVELESALRGVLEVFDSNDTDIRLGAVANAKAVLAQLDAPHPAAPQLVPVAWRVHPFEHGIGYEGVYAMTTRTDQVEAWKRKGWTVEPLYAAPQPAAPQSDPCAPPEIQEAIERGEFEPGHWTISAQRAIEKNPSGALRIIARLRDEVASLKAAPQSAQAVPQPAALTVAEVDKLINTAQELGAARGWDMREKLHYLVHLTNGIKQPGSEAC